MVLLYIVYPIIWDEYDAVVQVVSIRIYFPDSCDDLSSRDSGFICDHTWMVVKTDFSPAEITVFTENHSIVLFGIRDYSRVVFSFRKYILGSNDIVLLGVKRSDETPPRSRTLLLDRRRWFRSIIGGCDNKPETECDAQLYSRVEL
jgi:hypothetical protein